VRYTVTTTRLARAKLATIWAQARDRQAVADASDQIDLALRDDAHLAGHSRGQVRSLHVPPLQVEFTVSPVDCLVTITSYRYAP
jgi:hypothetical protein